MDKKHRKKLKKLLAFATNYSKVAARLALLNWTEQVQTQKFVLAIFIWNFFLLIMLQV